VFSQEKNLQVKFKFQVNSPEFTSAVTSVHINVLCLTVILTVKL
jgi:hypothetical protein